MARHTGRATGDFVFAIHNATLTDFPASTTTILHPVCKSLKIGDLQTKMLQCSTRYNCPESSFSARCKAGQAGDLRASGGGKFCGSGLGGSLLELAQCHACQTASGLPACQDLSHTPAHTPASPPHRPLLATAASALDQRLGIYRFETEKINSNGKGRPPTRDFPHRREACQS